MKNMIKMDDIIAFIERAMKENLKMATDTQDYTNFSLCRIEVCKTADECVVFEIYKNDNCCGAKIRQGILSNWVDIEISEMDFALFKVEFLKAQEYAKNKVIKAFNDFFKDMDSRPTTINDLDDEND